FASSPKGRRSGPVAECSWPTESRTCGTAQPGSKSLRSTASSTGNSPAGVGLGQQFAGQGVGQGGGAAGHVELGEDVPARVVGCRPAGGPWQQQPRCRPVYAPGRRPAANAGPGPAAECPQPVPARSGGSGGTGRG